MKPKKGFFVYLILLIAVLQFPLAIAQPPEAVWVDDDADPEWYDSTHLLTIQKGINAINEGGTVHVAGGTYEESVLIDKTLTLEGENRETTEIKFGYIHYPSKSPLTISADGITVSGFTIRSGPYIEPAWTVAIGDNSALFSDLHVIKEPCYYPNNKLRIGGSAFGYVRASIDGFTLIDSTVESAWNGIYTRGKSSNIIVQNVDFTYPGEFGIFLKTITGATIKQNTFRCIDDKYGVIVTRGSHEIDLTDNHFIGSGLTTDSHVGITLQAWSPYVMGDITVSENKISDFKVGIKIEHIVTSGIHINYNSITGNAYGIMNVGTNPVDATLNWWGTVVEDEIAGKIMGSVSYTPWLDSPPGGVTPQAGISGIIWICMIILAPIIFYTVK